MICTYKESDCDLLFQGVWQIIWDIFGSIRASTIPVTSNCVDNSRLFDDEIVDPTLNARLAFSSTNLAKEDVYL